MIMFIIIQSKTHNYGCHSLNLNPYFIDEDGMSAVTMWIVGDFEKDCGRKLLLCALRHMVSNISLFFHPFCCSALPEVYRCL